MQFVFRVPATRTSGKVSEIIKAQCLYQTSEPGNNINWKAAESGRVADRHQDGSGRNDLRAGFSYLLDKRGNVGTHSSAQTIQVNNKYPSQKSLASDKAKAPHPQTTSITPSHELANETKIAEVDEKPSEEMLDLTKTAKSIHDFMLSHNMQSRSAAKLNREPTMVPPRTGTPMVNFNLGHSSSTGSLPPLGPLHSYSPTTSTMLHITNVAKNKLKWYVDVEAYLKKDKFRELINLIKNTNQADELAGSQIQGALLQMADYFERLIFRIFADHRLKFFSNPDFRNLFTEELARERTPADVKKSLILDDSTRHTPVTLALKQLNAAGYGINSAQKSTTMRMNSILFSPTSNVQSAKITQRISSSDFRHKNVRMADLDSLLGKLNPAVIESMKTKQKREWSENYLHLALEETFHVLVVDDSVKQAETVVELLESLPNVTTEMATDGDKAVKMIKQKLEKHKMFHLILTDIHMPYDGFKETLDIRKLESEWCSTPRNCIIGVTAEGLYASSDVQARNCGMDDIVTKPLRVDFLRAMFEKRAKELGLTYEDKLASPKN